MAAWQPELVPSTAAVLSGAKRSSRGDARRPIISTPAQIAARKGRRRWARGAGNLIHFGHCTMALLHQSAWQSSFSANLLPIWCSDGASFLYQSYSPMFQLQLCYGNHTQTCTGSCLNLGSKIDPPHCQTRFQSSVSLTVWF